MGSCGAFRALVTTVSLRSRVCSFMSLSPHSKGAMHACARSFKQTCTFASCFSIFLHFLTTTETTSCIFPFPPAHSMKNTSTHRTLHGQAPTADDKTKGNPCSPAVASQGSSSTRLSGQGEPYKVAEAAWQKEAMCWEMPSSCPGLPRAGTAPAQTWSRDF